MATSNLATPGVYIQELNLLPASVAAVPTAVPAFIGYTEKGPLNKSTRIESLPEFEAIFGGAFREKFEVVLADNVPPAVTPKSTGSDDTLSPYVMYYHLQMFYANGGGTCYIVAADHYNTADTNLAISKQKLLDGIVNAEETDEVTLLLAPDVVNIDTVTADADIKAVYDAMLAQCNKLKDRFTLMDVLKQDPFVSVSDDADVFRNFNVGANYLNYGAAYYPPLNTILEHRYLDGDVVIDDNRSGGAYANQPNNTLATILQGIGVSSSFDVTGTPDENVDYVEITALGSATTIVAGVDFAVGATVDETALAIVNAVNDHPVLSLVARAQLDSSDPSKVFIVTRNGSATTGDLSVTVSTPAWTTTPTSPAAGAINSQDTALYYSLKAAIAVLNGVTLYPSGTMAGIYAAVDDNRGVWKAPANVGVANIIGPGIAVTEAQQAGLNVDATSGKSINAIRTFTGRGTIVWGARTLEGNSNELRYVPVRRLFIMAEESIKKATEFVVFEPNDKNTWIRLKGMINNFLTDLWKQGALAGAKPDQAFFVQVGLGETMTAQDILEGRCIITIGMAAVRPAEFIILRFMHKLQENG